MNTFISVGLTQALHVRLTAEMCSLLYYNISTCLMWSFLWEKLVQYTKPVSKF